MSERRDAFLLCRHCGLLTPLAPSAPWASTDDDASELAAFRAAHAAHGVEAALRCDELARTDRPAWDPLATRWFTVAVGAELLTVRSSRRALDDPRQYEIAAAGSPPTSSWVDVDEALLRRALDRHFYPHVIHPMEVDAFVGTVRELLAPLDPAEIDIAFDDPTLPDAGIGPFPAALVERLVERCATLFDAVALERAHSFIRDHRAEDGALAVRVHRALVTRAA
ncbi:hypothetical protein KF840_06000 [bacterium]|nr:hypothetical protein [bacterium]